MVSEPLLRVRLLQGFLLAVIRFALAIGRQRSAIKAKYDSHVEIAQTRRRRWYERVA
jgi:hypothetical protein